MEADWSLPAVFHTSDGDSLAATQGPVTAAEDRKTLNRGVDSTTGRPRLCESSLVCGHGHSLIQVDRDVVATGHYSTRLPGAPPTSLAA